MYRNWRTGTWNKNTSISTGTGGSGAQEPGIRIHQLVQELEPRNLE